MEQNLFKALICDDSILIRKKLKDLLLANGYSEIFEAVNGQDAIDKYKLNQPNVVFMDIVMPIKTGIDAVKEILEFDNKAKIIMASSSGTKNNLREALEAGAFEFIQKPFESEQILSIINKLKKEA